MQQLVLVTVPNGKESAESTFASISSRVSYGTLHKFLTPALFVGTLDSLISLSDDLAKISSQVEVIFFEILKLILLLF